MTALIIFAIVVLLGIVVVQIGKVTELSASIRGEEEVELRSNRIQGKWLMIFMVIFLVFCFASAYYFKNWMLGYGPHLSASEHGIELDQLFNITLFFTGIVFVITQIALFYFSWKYHGRKERRASFISHNNTLEIVWSAIPAVVMTFLVVKGLVAWNNTMADVDPDEEVIEIEATGYQFAWHIRYPGDDGILGTRNFRLIEPGTNDLGQDWTDEKNLDDFHPTEIVLPVDKKVRVRITARDVLHNFYLPHFRVKMDAIPGIPTYFVFTPTMTTEEYRERLSGYPEYNVPKDPSDPESELLWESYDFELACAELCGSSHFAMRRIVRIVSEEEYEAWKDAQQSFYISSIRGTDKDPFADQILDSEVRDRRIEVRTAFESAMASTSNDEKLVPLNYLIWEDGELNKFASYQVDDLAELLVDFPETSVEIRAYSDSEQVDATAVTVGRAQEIAMMLGAAGVDASRIASRGMGVDADGNNRVEIRIN